MKTSEAVKGKWALVLKSYDLPLITGKHHFKGKCPICAQRGKFRIDDKNGSGSYICVCGAGDGWKLLNLTQKKDFSVLAKEVDVIIGNVQDYSTNTRKVINQSESLRNRVLNKFSRLHELKGTAAERYLNNREIKTLPTGSIKFCEQENTADGVLSAIYSLATDANNNPCYLHRTFLDGDKKAGIEACKKMNSLQDDTYLEHAQSIAVRLFPSASTLGIAEGIETALSSTQIYKCNTWSTLNASLMKKFRAPTGVEHLIIFTDTDKNGTGHAAAFECGNRNLLSNNDVKRVTIRWPEFGDFNDTLTRGDKVYEWTLTR